MIVVIVGGGPAGYSAAKAAASVLPAGENEIHLFTESSDVGYCLGSLLLLFDGSVNIADTESKGAEELAKMGVSVYTRTKVIGVNFQERYILLEDGKRRYDRLIFAVGSGKRRRISLAGGSPDQVYELSSFEDGLRVASVLKSKAELIVLGTSYVGTEIACVAPDNHAVTLVDSTPFLKMPGVVVDPDLEEQFRNALAKRGVRIIMGVPFGKIELDAKGMRIGNQFVGGNTVIDAKGGEKEDSLKFIRNSELEFASGGLIKVGENMQTSISSVFAAGTCTSYIDFMGFQTPSLGEAAAHIQGWAAGLSAAGKETLVSPLVMPGLLVSKEFELGTAGYSSLEISREKGLDVVWSEVESHTRPSFHAIKHTVLVRLFFEKNTKRLLGGVLWGKDGVRERIGVLEAALRHGSTAKELASYEGAFLPSVNVAPDPITLAARKIV
jgi:NADPH-dependent 2,4-dienoyl-CoA reductase/sulfur reductase-like enzyme